MTVPMAAIILSPPALAAGPDMMIDDGSQQTAMLSHAINPYPLQNLSDKVYTKPARVPDITSEQVMSGAYAQPAATPVSKKVGDLNGQLSGLENKLASASAELSRIEKDNQRKSAEYYAAIATINTQLQSGTTPGNPRLTRRLDQAGASLDSFTGNMGALNALSEDLSKTASEASFLLEATRAAYGISGAVEEDHVHLAQLEDKISALLVLLERITNNVTDDLSRTTAYLSAERNNLRTIALGVENGDVYGRSLSNRPFSSNVGSFMQASATPAETVQNNAPQKASLSSASSLAPLPAPQAAAPAAPRLLAKIKFDKPDVNYQQPVYMAVNEAMQRYPNATFDLVAVHPAKGNAAQVAIESTKARRNAEKVLRSLTQMGLPAERLNLSYQDSAEAATSEVHVYLH